jgi:hypothetical protein
MISILNSLARQCPRLLAVLILCLLPSSVLAETVTFRNDCRYAVVVQLATVEKGVLRREAACLLRCNEITGKAKLNTDKLVIVYDGKSNRILFKDVLRVSKTELNYSIQPDPKMPGKVKMLFYRKPPAKPGAGKTTRPGKSGSSSGY